MIKPVVAFLLFSQIPFPIVPGSVPAVEAATVTSATYAPIYTRLTANVADIKLLVNKSSKAQYTASDNRRNSKVVTAEATYKIDKTTIATVDKNGTVYAVSAGRTVLRIYYKNLSLALPVIITQPAPPPPPPPPPKPGVKPSDLNVYLGVNTERMQAHMQASYNLINSIRKEAGISYISSDGSLMRAAQAHANYQERYKMAGQTELTGRSGFSGSDPVTRARAFGYSTTNVRETAAATKEAPSGAVQEMIDSPYRRMALLMPSYKDFGIGVSDGYTVINTGMRGTSSADDSMLVYYPYHGQTDVPPSWLSNETPNPLQYFGKQRTNVGYPISISTSSGSKLTFDAATIFETGSKSVDYYMVDSTKSGIDYGLLLIPKEPLKPSTAYTVSASFTESTPSLGSSSTKKSYVWSFTTRSDTVSKLTVGSYNPSLKAGSSMKPPIMTATFGSGAKKDVTSTVEFSSDSDNVMIDNGSLVGVTAGTATLTASYENVTTTFPVIVSGTAPPPEPVTPPEPVPPETDPTLPPDSQPTTPPAVPEVPPGIFSDIGSHWAEATIHWAVDLTIADGYPDGTFKPNGNVTEAEFLAMLFRLYPVQQQTEVTPKVWSDPYYEFAMQNNLGLGDSAANISLRDSAMKRAKVARIIAKLSGNFYSTDDGSIQYLLDSGYSQGQTAATVAGYAGSGTLTRAEALQFLKNLNDKEFNIVSSDPTSNVASHHNITASSNEDGSISFDGVVEGMNGKTVKIELYGPAPANGQGMGTRIKDYSATIDEAGILSLQTDPVKDSEINIYVYVRPDLAYWYRIHPSSTAQ